jgi:hypothetical protein
MSSGKFQPTPINPLLLLPSQSPSSSSAPQRGSPGLPCPAPSHYPRNGIAHYSSACQGKPYPRNFTSRIRILAIHTHPATNQQKPKSPPEYSSYIIIKINLTTNQCQLTPRATDTFSIHPQIPSTTRLHDSSIRSIRTTIEPTA